MKFYVTHVVNARYIAEVEAETVEEAIEKAKLKYQEADFGEAEEIDADVVLVEDDNGEFVFEK